MNWSDKGLAELIGNGKTTREIADMFGTSLSAVRNAIRREGLKPNLPTVTRIHRIAEDLPPREAVDYLLAVLEEALPAVASDAHEIDGWGVGFTPVQRVILAALFEASPRPVSKDRLFGLIDASRDLCREDNRKLVAVHICNIRKKLPASRGRIRSHWGRGYAFEGAQA